MKMRLPLVPVSWRIAAPAAACMALLLIGSARAAPVAGEYSLALNATADSVDVGGEFVVQTVIEPGAEPPYQAAQWEFNIDPEYSEVVSIEASAGAPSGCNFTSDRAPTILVGCIELSGPTLTHSGATFDVRLRCLQAGTLQFELNRPKSFVGTATSNNEPSHLHGDTIVCGGDDTVIVPPTSTPPPPSAGETPPAPVTPGVPAGTPDGVATEEAGATSVRGTPDADATSDDGDSNAAGGGRTPLAGAGASSNDDGDDDGDDDAPVWPWLVVAGVVAAVAVAGLAYWQVRTRAGSGAHPG